MQPQIDVVCTWAGADSDERRQQRALWARQEQDRAGRRLAPDALSGNRRADLGELRYVLRSIALYAPFVRRLFLVTPDGQRPAWLAGHPQVQVVPDAELFPDTQALPTFNSQAIECYLHRVPGVTDYFLYLNDDMFVGRPLDRRHLFGDGGRVKVCVEDHYLIPGGTPAPGDNAYLAAWRNNQSVLDQRFGAQRRVFPVHQAALLSKELLMAMHADLVVGPALARTAHSRFRSTSDVAPVGLHAYYALHVGAAELGEVDQIMVRITHDTAANAPALAAILRRRPTFFCLNDDTSGDAEPVREQLRSFLGRYFPAASAYEAP